MNYPIFEGADNMVEAQIIKSADILLQHAQALGLETEGSGLSHYITNMANVMYDHDNDKYIDSMRGVIALLEKAAKNTKNNKAVLFEILNKGRELHGAEKKTDDEGSTQAYTAIKLLSFINHKTKAFKLEEAAILVQELQNWLDRER